jgi:hypothetical protein
MTKQWGGRRPGAGRPFRKRLRLSDEDGRALGLLTRHLRDSRSQPDLREEDVVGELVREALQKIEPPPAE